MVAQRRHLPGLRPELRRRATATAPATSPASASRLPYLRDLGVDAIWFTPWYASPLADGGYDVADYRAIDPAFGTLAEAEALIAEALELGIRTIVDIVPNHVSDQHPWFQAALAAGPGLAGARLGSGSDPGRGPDGDEMPTDWPSNFAGATWTRTTNPDGTPGEWYLHLFTAAAAGPQLGPPGRPRASTRTILRFWFDRGVGRRPDRLGGAPGQGPGAAGGARRSARPASTRNTDRDELHDIYRELARRSPTPIPATASSSARSGCRTWTGSPATSARTSSTRPSTSTSWPGRGTPPACAPRSTRRSPRMRRSARPPTWVLSNHDVTRPVTRYGREDSSFAFATQAARHARPISSSGRRRARAAALLSAALPGLALHLPGRRARPRRGRGPASTEIQDPMHFRSGGIDPGRDGCRVPLPWSGDAPPFGFSPDGATGRAVAARQPAHWAEPDRRGARLPTRGSMLNLYRAALRDPARRSPGSATAR